MMRNGKTLVGIGAGVGLACGIATILIISAVHINTGSEGLVFDFLSKLAMATTLIGLLLTAYTYTRRRGSLLRKLAPIELLWTVMSALIAVMLILRNQVTVFDFVAWVVAIIATFVFLLRLQKSVFSNPRSTNGG